MRRPGCLLLALIAAWLPAQESRPESRPGGSLFVLGATSSGDRIFKLDPETLAVNGTHVVEGFPSYGAVTPNGEGLILTTTRRGLNVTRSTLSRISPASLEAVWHQASDDMLSWKGPSSYPVVTDATVPDTVAFLHINGFDLPELQHILGWAAELVTSRGVRTIVPLPEDTTRFALWRRDGATSIIAVTSWNHLWSVDAATGVARRITHQQLAPSWTRQPSDEGGVEITHLFVSQAANEAVCFTRAGEVFVVKLDTGAASRRPLGSDFLVGQKIAFAYHERRSGRWLVCRQDDYCGGNLFVLLDADFKETASLAIMGAPFLDAVFCPDGTQFATLTMDGIVRVHDSATARELRRSPDALPLMQGSVYCASFAGWR